MGASRPPLRVATLEECARYGKPRPQPPFPPIAGGAGYALVGSLGAVNTGSSGATNTPAFGTGETRAAGNLLVLWAWVNSTTNPGAIANWSLAEQKGLGDSCSIYYKIATGGDAAPTVPAVSGGTIVAMLGEFSGNAAATPLDQVNLATTTATSPLVVTAPSADAAAGELVIVCSATQYTSGTATDGSNAINNGATTHNTVGHLNTTNHYGFGWGITTGNSGADSNSWTFPTTSAAHAVTIIASFKVGAVAASVQQQLMTAGVGS